MEITDMSHKVQDNLNQSLENSNQQMEQQQEQPTQQTINLNGSYMFQDEESMDHLMNNIGLAVQRQGGQ